MKNKFFIWVTNNPIKIVTVGILLIIFFAIGVTKVVKDTSADSFIAKDHPALVNKNRLSELFGLKDPMIMIIKNENGIFNPDTLKLVVNLSQKIQEFKDVKNDGVTSLYTQKNIYGVSDGMEVESFLDDEIIDEIKAKEVEKAIDAFTLMQGTLVSKDKKTTLIIAELKDTLSSEDMYNKFLALKKENKNNNIQLYVAGEGAVSGYMGAYIDHDATRLNPIAAIIIMIMLFIAFRRFGAVMLPNLIIAGAAVIALGAMGYSGVSFFVITNALPVVLIGISVADSIHILSTYYERRRDEPQEEHKNSVVNTMLEMWSPIGLTTLTTMAGFLGLSLSSTIPPMIYFGIFAMIGVGVAWIYSITVLPALMAIFKLKHSPLFKKREKNSFTTFTRAGLIVANYPKLILSTALLIAIIGLLGVPKIVINEDRITTFSKDEPIVEANDIINTHFNGSHYLDILVDSFKEEGLFNTEVMKKVELLQEYAQTLKHVKGSVAYTDYLKQMNMSLNEADKTKYKLPYSANAAAQYFLLYSARSAADDFENILDYDYRLANVRVYIDSGEYIDDKEIVTKVEKYLSKNFNDKNVKANVSGRVNVDYHWVLPIEKSHFLSVAISLLLVFLMAWLTFKSFQISILVVLPVILSIVMIYGIMGYSGIWLGIGTSMFASIAIGLGVDFAVHTAQKMHSLEKTTKDVKERAIALYSTTGRALFFNALALTFGFGVLVTSKVVPLIKFGSLVAVAISSSFIFSLLIIPAAMILIHKDKK